MFAKVVLWASMSIGLDMYKTGKPNRKSRTVQHAFILLTQKYKSFELTKLFCMKLLKPKTQINARFILSDNS